MNTLLAYNTWVFYGVIAVVCVIMVLFILAAWRNRTNVDFYFGDEPGGNSSDTTRVPIRRLDYFVDVYAKKLIQGFIVSVIFIFLVSLPFLLLRLAT